MNRELSDAIVFQVGAELQSQRERAGLTLDDLADDTGLSPASLSLYLRGIRAMPLHVVLLCCDALAIEPADILIRARAAVATAT